MMRDLWDEFSPLVIVLLAMGALVFCAMAVASHIAFPAAVAEIEAIRHDAARVDPARAEDVIGQVTTANRTIASKQAYNRVPVVCLTIPNGWDDIEPIPVPTNARENP